MSISNRELMLKFQKLLTNEDMSCIAYLARRSEDMLDATLRGGATTMAEIIGAALAVGIA